jgi:predicted CoA-substrate-specific enzyme activase
MEASVTSSCQTSAGGNCTQGSCGSLSTPAPIGATVEVSLPKKRAAKRPTVVVQPFAGTQDYPQGLMIGLDVGSTTVKAVVIDPVHDTILWQDYQRHDTKQAEKALEFLERIEAAFPGVPPHAFRVFATGSGGGALVAHIGGKFVQEVNAVSLAVEKLYPEVQSVVELGGQDAKIIIFKETGENTKKKIPSMNDKCAGGTGAVIDKINAKLRIPAEKLCDMGYYGLALHPVAGKCGVFAETDINSLQKQGVPPAELMASLFESIIQQNLSVLTRGHTLRPTVLLLGGPNTYIKGMQECWRHNIAQMWQERKVELPDPSKSVDDYVITPENAQYFAALGAVEFGKTEIEDDANIGVYHGRERLGWYIEHGRSEARSAVGGAALSKSDEELAAFRSQYRMEPWDPAQFAPGERVQAFIGIDGGSTSTKGVLLGTDRQVLAKAYQLSKGNPIEDTMEIIEKLAQQVTEQGARLEVLGVGTTGYAKDILKDVLKADTALVETVAHTEACLHFYPGTDVIVDVGGQDIKLIVLKDGRVKDFKLNTQCSAGNGYFLQSTAQGFGFDIRDYADMAFSADAMPEFGYGCAVFMQSDIVDFQRKGWAANEIMAGLAAVLPKNIWLYVAQIPNLAKFGNKFVLQGGTQYNLAAVKAQVDFIRSRFQGSEEEPEVIVHRHCGESGAIGCALEAQRLWAEQGNVTQFIGLDRVRQIHYTSTRTEDTRCYFCKNQCLRTFIDVDTGEGAPVDAGDGAGVVVQFDRSARKKPGEAAEATAEDKREKTKKWQSKVPLEPGRQRLIIATCEKGTVEDLGQMREIKAGIDEIKERNPNFVEIASRSVFKEVRVNDVSDPPPIASWYKPFTRRAVESRRALMERRKQVRIGFPRVLNMYSHAPFFLGYFGSLGISHKQIVFSDYTDQDLYKRGAKRGSIDPCYPSKLGIPHVHDLIHRQQKHKPLTHIFFPMVDSFPTPLHGVQASRACPTVVATAEATHAAFVKEGDLFKENNIVFKKTFLNLDQLALAARQMYLDWKDEIGVSFEESARAVREGLQAMERHYEDLRHRQRQVLDELERENRIGVVMLGRPYHNDPGVNHEILDELQKLGYPVFWEDALPMDEDLLERLFGEEVRAGEIDSPLSIQDVWKNSYSENTSRKVWAAKFAARHPNLVALELSSFKCGHDAPIYTVVEEIIENSGTPYFCFKDIDENKPAGSIKIRIETIAYFLYRYRERLVNDQQKRAQIEEQLRHYAAMLRFG